MQTKAITGGFIIEVFLFFSTGFAYAHGSLLWILFLILGLGWAYRVGKWIELKAIEDNKEEGYIEKLLKEVDEKEKKDKMDVEKLMGEWK